jgi:hypothetical protein
MAIPFHKRINSIETVHSSIRNDPQVFRWFIKFVSHPAVRARLKDSPEDQKHYVLLKKITACQTVIYILWMLLTAVIFLTKQGIWLMLGLPLLLRMHKLSTQQKTNVADLSCSILKADHDTKTLYQICEYYGKSLSTATLVDIITKQDDILRRTIIYVCVLTCLIYPIGFWNDWIILSTFILARALINTPLVFDRLK